MSSRKHSDGGKRPSELRTASSGKPPRPPKIKPVKPPPRPSPKKK
ncbi:MAG: hypothetical protein OXG81_00420 [Acidobacteria bacterium]|nr:hypothetical protein [Acidobacteriota bacterium]